MSDTIKIGTRKSALAVWQATFIQTELKKKGRQATLVFIDSDGEDDLKTPLYEMGIQGIFTKTLDTALLDKRIDIAVHSLKDVPTQLASGLTIAAVPKRGNPSDVLVYKNNLPTPAHSFCVATGSLRRSAQWLHHFPTHKTVPMRGNLQTRLDKIQSHTAWDGGIFAEAGLSRIQLHAPNLHPLDWMVPAPAQGALAVVSRNDDTQMQKCCQFLNHPNSQLCTSLERQFLRNLMGGCSMPIGAWVQIENDEVSFVGCVLTVDGKQKAQVSGTAKLSQADKLIAEKTALLLKENGAHILKTFSR